MGIIDHGPVYVVPSRVKYVVIEYFSDTCFDDGVCGLWGPFDSQEIAGKIADSFPNAAVRCVRPCASSGVWA